MIRGTLQALRHRLAGPNARERGGALILLYHRLGDNRWDPWSLGVAPQRFAEHMRLIARRMRPMSLGELAESVLAGRVPARAVAVTFDDGYAAHVDALVDVTQRTRVPVTSFLCSGAVDAGREFWWDELARALLGPEAPPRTLRLETALISLSEELGADAPAEAGAESSRALWRAWDPPPGSRERVYVTLHERMLALDDASRRSVLDDLLQWGGVGPRPRDSHRLLTSEEARALAAAPRMSIGAHTVTHPRLSSLDVGEQEREIGESKRALEEIIARPVTEFAYPFGRTSDYDSRTVELVRALGFAVACANVVGAVTSDAKVLELPRVQVQDWSAEELSHRIDRWGAAA